MVVKYLLVVLVVAFVLWMMLVRGRGDGDRGDGREKKRRQPPHDAQPMVECAHCGLHLPAGEAVVAGSQVFCSEAHRTLGARPHGPR